VSDLSRRRWDKFNPVCDTDHSGDWANKISQRITQQIDEDRELLKNIRKA
jgi:hypothetical protein